MHRIFVLMFKLVVTVASTNTLEIYKMVNLTIIVRLAIISFIIPVKKNGSLAGLGINPLQG